MKNRFFLLSLAVLLMAGCSDDSSSAGLATTCGDGELNGEEICDGDQFKEGVKVCPDGLIPKDASAFKCTDTCGLDFSKACAAPTCGDGELTAGEVCDQDKFREGVKVCPNGMEEVEAPEWGCTNTCLLDITNACKIPENTNNNTCEDTCNNGKLDVDAGEICEGEEFAPNVKKCPDNMVELASPVYSCNKHCELDISKACVESICGDGRITGQEVCDGSEFATGVKVCPSGQKPVSDRDLFTCNACSLDTTYACIANDAKEPTLYISEIRMIENDAHDSFNHLYIEIGNIGEETPISDCKLVGIKLDATDSTKIDTNFVFEQSLASAAEKLGNSVSDPKNVIGVCYEPTEGWLNTQYDDKTLTYEECQSMYNALNEANIECRNVCETEYWSCIEECGEGSTCRKTCEDSVKDCNAACQTVNFNIYECEAKAELRLLSESCSIMIPSNTTSLKMTMTGWTQYSGGKYNTADDLWGIGVMCGEAMHDMIKIDGITKQGGSRMCVPNDKLSDIIATGDTVYDGSYQGNSDAKSYQMSYNEWYNTFGEASCGRVDIN